MRTSSDSLVNNVRYYIAVGAALASVCMLALSSLSFDFSARSKSILDVVVLTTFVICGHLSATETRFVLYDRRQCLLQAIILPIGATALMFFGVKSSATHIPPDRLSQPPTIFEAAPLLHLHVFSVVAVAVFLPIWLRAVSELVRNRDARRQTDRNADR